LSGNPVSDDFDMQAAWLRRFTADAESSLGAFARRLQEAMPDRVTVHEKRGFFSAARVTGVVVELGDCRYALELAGGRLLASVALVARGVTLNTRQLDPAQWFARLAEETRQATAQAEALSRSLSSFMAG
jgi:hypothetical protein